MQNRVNQALGPAAGRSAPARRDRAEVSDELRAGRPASTPSRASTTRSSSRNYIDVYVKDALKRVPGVADVIIFGERKLLDARLARSVRLAARQLTAGDVVNALREQNVNVAAGSVGDSPAPEGRRISSASARRGRLHERVRSSTTSSSRPANGRLARPPAGCRRAWSSAPRPTASSLRFQGRDAVGFGVIALPTANALDVEHAA